MNRFTDFECFYAGVLRKNAKYFAKEYAQKQDIEASVLALLLEAVEQEAKAQGLNKWLVMRSDEQDDLDAYGDAREAYGRMMGLEEAAQECEERSTVDGIAQECAKAIRRKKS